MMTSQTKGFISDFFCLLLYSVFCPSHIATDGQSVSLGVEPHLVLMTRYLLLFDSCGLVFYGAPSLTRGRVRLLYMLQSLSGPSPSVLATKFYCLRFEASLFVASYDSQGHGGSIRPRLHTGICVGPLDL
jgi:hypothetical protein